MTGAYFVAAGCCFCGKVFGFNPERVPSIPVDAHGNVTASGVKRPICEGCMGNINKLRESHGEPPIAILPGAYEAVEGMPE